MYEEILYEVTDPIATITLNRPHALNAWTERMGAEIKHAVAEAEDDPAVVAIVITGAGRGFCAGADMNSLQEITEGGRETPIPKELEAQPGDPEMGEDFQGGTHTYMLSVKKPVIAAINGPAAGMALPILLACDLRFASEKAVFTMAFSKRGLIAEWGCAWLLPRIMGTGHALDLLFSSRKIDAQEAERIHLVNRTLPHDQLLPYVREYVENLGAEVAPASLQIMKRQVYQQLTREFGPSEKEAVTLMIESFDRPDFREGVMSFVEKRPPKFQRV